MITVKIQRPSKKEFKVLEKILQDYSDVWRDFYLTKENLRLFIRENFHLFKKCLKAGDKVAFDEDRGIAFVTGFSDNAKRKYIKLLYNNIEDAGHLLKSLIKNIDCDLWAKIKQNNPLTKVLMRNGFIHFKNRGREILFYRKANIGENYGN